MRKIIALTLISIFVGGAATAGEKWWVGTENECYRHRNSSGDIEFFFCGDQYQSCAGFLMKNSRDHEFLYHGKYFKKNGKFMYCCNGRNNGQFKVKAKNNGQGTFVESDKEFKETPKTIPVDGGTCTYTVKETPCGDIIDVPCTKRTSCSQGYDDRNGECVKPCGSGKYFESEYSNNCIKCETTYYQGPDTLYKNCKQCDKATQFYDYAQRACVAKSTLKAYYNQVMKKCFACSGPDTFRQCIDLFSKPESDWKTNTTLFNSVSKACQIDNK